MKVILQKVKKASVSVDGKIVGEIDKGYCLLVGVHKESTEADAKYLAKKIVEARLFEDENEKLNLGLKDVFYQYLNLLFMLIQKKGSAQVLPMLLVQKKQMNYIVNLMNI